MASIQKSEPRPTRRRYKAAVACTTCRRRKLKCDGIRPACTRCQGSPNLRSTCVYAPVSAPADSSEFNTFSSGQLSSALPSDTLKSEASPELDGTYQQGNGADRGDGDDDLDNFSDGDPSEFSFHVKTTIDTKLGLPAGKQRCPIPLTDAAMFASFPNDKPFASSHASADDVLPQRRHADHLVALYWRTLEPLEPLLDREQFFRCYEALFSGVRLLCDESLFLSTLNVIFALATQLQESIPADRRDEASKTFFLRAWSLLKPEASIWNSASIELVRCLVLMARYLQCTNCLHQTWMVVGAAVRMSQGLGLHISDRTGSAFEKENKLKREIWYQCVYMDRSLSWSLGRMPMMPIVPLSVPTSSYKQHQLYEQGPYSTPLSVKTAELNQIIGHIMLLQAHASSALTETLGSPQLSRSTDSVAAVQIDECLNKLEDGLLKSTSFPPQVGDAEIGEKGRQILLRLRIIHARILLFRPMLVRFCLVQSKSQSPSSTNPGLGDRVLQSGATICVESAGHLISLVNESARAKVTVEPLELPSSLGSPSTNGVLLPWWYRVFYLHVACQHLISAMLRPDVFAHTVSSSWANSIAALQAHEHISPSVGRCLRAFQRMWTKVKEIHSCSGEANAGGGVQTRPCEQNQELSLQQGQGEAHVDFDIQDVLQGLEFEAENPLFAMESFKWLDSFDSNA